jgi:hypothetical protein
MRGIFILFTLAGLLFFTKANAQTASITLSWSPSSSSSVAGYYIYYGGVSGDYTNVVPVQGGSATGVTIKGLASGVTYYFAAASYNSSYTESGLSPEISGVAGSSSVTSVAASLTSTLMSAGHFGFNVSGVSNGLYIVQASTNLVNWVNLLTNMSPFSFVDSNATHFSHRFYRTAYIPSN